VVGLCRIDGFFFCPLFAGSLSLSFNRSGLLLEERNGCINKRYTVVAYAPYGLLALDSQVHGCLGIVSTRDVHFQTPNLPIFAKPSSETGMEREIP
jgi:hypothetical protein